MAALPLGVMPRQGLLALAAGLLGAAAGAALFLVWRGWERLRARRRKEGKGTTAQPVEAPSQ